MKKTRSLIKGKIYGLYFLAIAVFLACVSLTPILTGRAEAAYGQLTARSLTISSGVPSGTNVSYTFQFTPASTVPPLSAGQAKVQGLKFLACQTAIATYPTIGGCSAPAGLSFTSAAFGSQSGWQGGTNFAVDNTGANDCTPAANILCANRTNTTDQTSGAHSITFTTITNPSTANTSFYVGIYTYTTNNYLAGNLLDFGATATAVVQTLETDAFVAEVLQFCVGSTTVDDADTTLIATDCAGTQGTAVSGTALNIGTLDTSTVNVSPVTTNGGDGKNGVAMVRSNAGNGVVVDYDAIQQSGTNHLGTLRISGANCDGSGAPAGGFNPATNDFVDSCINAAGSNQNVFTAGTEEFGMTVAGVNSKGTTSYSCVYDHAGASANTCHLEPASNYLGGGGIGTEVYGSTNGFAWDETGTAVTIASSASSTVKQVDDEALVLKFAATPSITTPFGRYAAQTDFIAVPTY